MTVDIRGLPHYSEFENQTEQRKPKNLASMTPNIWSLCRIDASEKALNHACKLRGCNDVKYGTKKRRAQDEQKGRRHHQPSHLHEFEFRYSSGIFMLCGQDGFAVLFVFPRLALKKLPVVWKMEPFNDPESCNRRFSPRLIENQNANNGLNAVQTIFWVRFLN